MSCNPVEREVVYLSVCVCDVHVHQCTWQCLCLAGEKDLYGPCNHFSKGGAGVHEVEHESKVIEVTLSLSSSLKCPFC